MVLSSRSVVTFLLTALADPASGQFAPVTFNTFASPACKNIQCAALECPKGFTWVNAKDSGSCCPLCRNEELEKEAAFQEPVAPVNTVNLHDLAPPGCIGAGENEAGENEGTRVWCPETDGFCAPEDKVYEEGSCCWQCKNPTIGMAVPGEAATEEPTGDQGAATGESPNNQGDFALRSVV